MQRLPHAAEQQHGVQHAPLGDNAQPEYCLPDSSRQVLTSNPLHEKCSLAAGAVRTAFKTVLSNAAVLTLAATHEARDLRAVSRRLHELSSLSYLGPAQC